MKLNPLDSHTEHNPTITKAAVNSAVESENIIELATVLGLAPRPTNTSEIFWFARCPENHVMYLNLELNTFSCGDCMARGGLKELASFCIDHKD